MSHLILKYPLRPKLSDNAPTGVETVGAIAVNARDRDDQPVCHTYWIADGMARVVRREGVMCLYLMVAAGAETPGHVGPGNANLVIDVASQPYEVSGKADGFVEPTDPD